MGRLLFCAVRGLIRTAFKNVRILSSELVWKPLFLPRYREVFLPFSMLFPFDFWLDSTCFPYELRLC